ncbi:MAG: dienelactone hydrolase family protein [Phycisphaerales bacterium]
MKSLAAAATVLLICVASARAEIVTKAITYEHNGVTLEGYIAYDDATDARLPGVLVIHEWWGHNDYAQRRARMLAEQGYIAFALDMYGKGTLADTPQDASALATPFYQDRTLMRTRARAGLDVLADHPRCDDDRLAAIGYCFGGTVALELARSGAPLDAVVSFHGGLSTPNPDDANNITGSVLVCNGAVDDFVSEDERRAFRREMEDAGVDYQFIEYGGAVHSFTNPEADALNMDSVAYDEHADRRSWRAMLALFDETLR